MPTFEQRDHFVEYSAELLDCASYLIELSAERVEYSRELSAFTKPEKIFASRELIEYNKQLNARGRCLLGRAISERFIVQKESPSKFTFWYGAPAETAAQALNSCRNRGKPSG